MGKASVPHSKQVVIKERNKKLLKWFGIFLIWPFYLLWWTWKRSTFGKPIKYLLTTIGGISALFWLSTAFAVFNGSTPSTSPTPSPSSSSATQVPGIAKAAVVTKAATPSPTKAAPTAPTAVPTPTPTPAQYASLPASTKTTDCHESNGLPDSACTPGASNPAVTQANIKSTICVSGYTATIRPSTSYTDNLKTQQIKAYGYTDTSLSDYEEDHLVSLELGGSPTSAANLWPEPHTGTYTSAEKDKVENYLHTEVCNGSLSLATAQQEIATNWVAVYTAHYTSLSTASTSDPDDTVATPTPAATPKPTPAPTSTPTPATASFDPDNPPVKMSTSNICHAQGDEYYDRTTNFTPFNSMADCVAAGGRPSQ